MKNVLTVLLFLVAIGGVLTAGSLFGAAQSAIHEIEAFIALLIGVCALGFVAVSLHVDAMRTQTVEAVNRSTQVAITEAKLAETRAR